MELLYSVLIFFQQILLKAIANNGWTEPTLVQERGIPLILEGKDMLLRARTGSGKTAAFVIPVLQKILMSKEVRDVKCCLIKKKK